MPQGSDGSWAQKLYQTHLGSSHFQKPKRPMDAFIVCHFAGKVGELQWWWHLAGWGLGSTQPDLQDLLGASPAASALSVLGCSSKGRN